MHPIIAITTYGLFEQAVPTTWYKHHYSLPAPYVDAVRRAGGIPVLLPPGEINISTTLTAIDGVLIAGGADIHPSEYGGMLQHQYLTPHDIVRDKFELSLVDHLVVNNNIPTLCICRGMQILNVALGGSLHEHVSDILPEDIHRSKNGSWTVHDINIKPASRLAEVMQSNTTTAYSGHHQAIKDIAPKLRVSALAPDGIVEAIEHIEAPWILGVQWHPEITAADDHTQQNIFNALVEEASKNSSNQHS